MSLDPHSSIAVVSSHGYRAQSIALAVGKSVGCPAKAFTDLDLAKLADFGTILLEVSASLDSTMKLVSQITARYTDAKVILLGLEESEENVVRLAESGATGYVAPTASLEELIAILVSISRGEFNCPPHITFALFSHLAYLASGSSPMLPKSPVLTMRERRVVELLSHNLTNKEIGARLCISESTAKNHVQRILKKLGLHDRSQASRSPIFRWPTTSQQRLAGDANG